VEAAIRSLRPGGKLILGGIPRDDRTSFCASEARRKGLTIKLVRRMKHTYPRAIALTMAGTVRLQPLVTHVFPLEKADEAFATAVSRSGLKVCLRPTT
jgi:L-iditol 2-dehydrogenase